jgi:hypothetical protein
MKKIGHRGCDRSQHTTTQDDNATEKFANGKWDVGACGMRSTTLGEFFFFFFQLAKASPTPCASLLSALAMLAFLWHPLSTVSAGPGLAKSFPVRSGLSACLSRGLWFLASGCGWAVGRGGH